MLLTLIICFHGGSNGKESALTSGDLGWEDPLEKGMATHSSILAWTIPWTEEPGRLWGHKESDMTEELIISPSKNFFREEKAELCPQQQAWS